MSDSLEVIAEKSRDQRDYREQLSALASGVNYSASATKQATES